MHAAEWTGAPPPDDPNPRRRMTIDELFGTDFSALIGALDRIDPLTIEDVARELRITLGVVDWDSYSAFADRLEAHLGVIEMGLADVVGDPEHIDRALDRAREVFGLLKEVTADFATLPMTAIRDALAEADRQEAAGRLKAARAFERDALAWADRLAAMRGAG